jgi:glutathione S-transferase
MKLYYSPGACSLAPHIVLREAGVPFSLERVDLKAKKLANGVDFNEINGKGYVPVLELDNGRRLTEGPAILQYIADLKPEARLAPRAGSFERYQLQEWLNFVTSEIHKQFTVLFKSDAPDAWKETARGNIAKRFDWVEKAIASKSYLTGDPFTVADAYFYAVLRWSPSQGIDLNRWSKLSRYLAAIESRPHTHEALKAEGLVK